MSTGKTKVDQYHWKMHDEPGEFRKIHKRSLHVDHRYQRKHVSKKRVYEFARDWAWSSCACIVVSQREDGSYWVLDGQHRKLAADKRSDIVELPCLVFKMASLDEEALAFLGLNTSRGPVQKIDSWDALITGRNDTALAIDAMVRATGYEVKPGGQRWTVSCVAALVRAQQKNPSIADGVWNLCVELYQGDSVNSKLHDALFRLEEHAIKHDMSILSGANRQKLVQVGVNGLMQKTNEAKALHGKGGDTVAAHGLLLLINKGRRSNFIPPLASY